jgi:UDP-N-acetylglucosamine 2-epimerase (non-hydrolysing)
MNKKKQKILFVFGTRPEAIKVAPLIKEFQKNPEKFDICVVSTGQHKEMLDQVVNFFQINIDYDLALMTKNQSLNALSARILTSLKDILDEEDPSYVFVHGDTTTTAFASIAAFYNQIKICHIEAGLRTFNKYSPFPEEINRTITGKLADIHFAPTQKARQNLIAEGVPKSSIEVTGNTVVDALLNGVELSKNFNDEQINHLKKTIVKNKKIILVTGHRRENFGKGFKNICKALIKISENKGVQIIYPVHLNPNVKNIVHEMLIGIPNIHLIEPLNYPAFTWLMNKSYIILTDSGGVQEEAPSLGVPVLVMRNNTERPEGVEAKTAILVGTDTEKIFKNVDNLLSEKLLYKKISLNKNPYGDGTASKKIVSYMVNNG